MRVSEKAASDQWPKERNPIFFTYAPIFTWWRAVRAARARGNAFSNANAALMARSTFKRQIAGDDGVRAAGDDLCRNDAAPDVSLRRCDTGVFGHRVINYIARRLAMSVRRVERWFESHGTNIRTFMLETRWP